MNVLAPLKAAQLAPAAEAAHALAAPADPPRAREGGTGPEAPLDAAPSGAVRLGLPALDALALTSFAASGHEALVEHARALAEALAGPDAEGARRRTCARALALARSQLDLLDAALGTALGRGDLKAVEVLSRAAERLTRRVEGLLAAHRLESCARPTAPPTVMLIGAAQNVRVGDGGD